jgi:hypothetical protein
LRSSVAISASRIAGASAKSISAIVRLSTSESNSDHFSLRRWRNSLNGGTVRSIPDPLIVAAD